MWPGKIVIILLLSLIPVVTNGQDTIVFSDGKILCGKITFSRGLHLQQNDRLQVISPDRIGQITFTPNKENLVQRWRFIQAGRTEKERWGKPYPVRHLQATVVRTDGDRLCGHLYTTVLYLEANGRTQKIVLRYKQSGNPGQTLANLVYPKRIELGGRSSTAATSRSIILRFPQANLGPAVQVCVISGKSWERLIAHPDKNAGQFWVPTISEPLFIAMRDDRRITVAWPTPAGKKMTVSVQMALAFVRDFFDHKNLLAVQHRAGSEDVYTLLMLQRKGKTTLAKTKRYPWRLEIWHWRYSPDEDRLMLAGRQYFFRGILASGKQTPPVDTAVDWCSVRQRQ